MSLQEISSLPPNKIVDERGEGNRGGGYRSALRLSQLTERAVDKALKLRAESGRLVDVVDTQSCGELGEFGCLIKHPFSPSALKILKNATILIPPSSAARSWALPKESQDRRVGAEKIYSSLMQWRSDVSFEWSSRVGLAVPVLEEALYKVAASREDYASSELLEHVLLHFEAGNGIFLLQGTKPLYPLRASHAASATGRTICGTGESCETGDSCEITHDDALSWENANVLHANNNLSLGLDSESCFSDSSFLWDGLEMRHTTPIKAAIHKRRNNPGKKITNKVVSLLSKRSDNLVRSRHELVKAKHSEENIPSSSVRVDDARTRMRKDGLSVEPSHLKQESPCYGDMRIMKNSRKTLGDMMNLNSTNLQAIGISVLINVDEACSMSSNCSKHTDMVHSFCTRKADPMKMEAMEPCPSSSNAASIEVPPVELMQSSSDQAKHYIGSSSLQALPTTLMSSPTHIAAHQRSPRPSKPKATPPCPAHSLSKSAASSAPFSTSSSSSSTSFSPSSLSTESSITLWASSHGSSSSSTTTLISLALPLPQVSSSVSCISSSSLSSSAWTSSSSSSPTSLSLASSLPQVSSSFSCVSSSSSSSSALSSSLVSPSSLSSSSVASSLSSSSVAMSLSASVVTSSSLSSHNSSSSVSLTSSSHTAQLSAASPLQVAPALSPTQSSIQPFNRVPPSPACLEGELSQEVATSQDIERKAARTPLFSTTSTATASNDSPPETLPEARDRGARLPLSIFLSEREELDVFSVAEMSGDNECSWNTWDEPTEQIDPLCCVCMVGLKGAAFIPCGHTFCRKCSRELWRGRGTCPLCNKYIKEILDVY